MAFLQEPERQPFLRVPAATAGLVIVLVLAHLARTLAPAPISQAILDNYAFFPARYSHAFMAAHGGASQSFFDQAIPFVSYIFLHAGFTHLAINCAWLLPFGSIVARRFGTLLFYAFFLACGAAGAFAHLLANWGSMEYVVGASAGISGLMGAAFRIIALVQPQFFAASAGDGSRFRPPLAPILSTRLLVWSAVWIGINVAAGITGLGAGPGPVLIAWQAHIGGYLAGLVLAGPFDRLAKRAAP